MRLTSALLIIIFLSSFSLAAAEKNLVPLLMRGESKPVPGGFEEGWQAYLEGRVDDAENFFRKVIKDQPDVHQAHFGLETVNSSMGRYPESFLNAVSAVREGVDSPWFELYLADAFSLRKYSDKPEVFTGVLREISERKDLTPLKKLLTRYYLASSEVDLSRRAEEYQKLPFIRKWLILGPFNNREKSGFSVDYGPEKIFPEVNPEKSYPARNREVKWFSPSANPPDGYYPLNDILSPGTESVAYAVSELDVPEKMQITLILGSAGAGSITVGRELLSTWDLYHGYHPFQRSFTFTAEKGRVKIMLKLAGERQGELGFSLIAIPGTLKGKTATNTNSIKMVTPLSTEPAAEISLDPEVNRSSDAAYSWGLCKILQEEIIRNPESGFARLMLGYLILDRQLDDRLFRRTKPLLDTAAERLPDCPAIQEFASLVQLDDNLARRYLERALKAHPEEVAASELLTNLLYRGGYILEAQKLCRKLLKRLPSAAAEETLSMIYRDRGWNAEAFAAAERAINAAPGKAELYHIQAGLVSEKIKQDAILMNGIKATGSTALIYQLAQGSQASPDDERNVALKMVDKAMTMEPFNPEAHRLKRDFALASSGPVKAVESLRASLSVLPQSDFLFESLGRQLIANNEKTEAISAWEKALTIKPDNPTLREYLQEIKPREEKFYDPYKIPVEEILADKVSPEDYPRYNIAVLLDQGVVYVHPNGTRDMKVHFIRQALTPNGARSMQHYSIPYDPQRARVEVLSAKVFQPDGSVLSARDVDDRSVQGGGAGATVYSRGHVKQITFPQVRKGAVVEISYLMEATGESIYGNSFEDTFYFGGNDPTVRFQYVLNTPVELGVRIKTFKEDKVGATRKEAEKGKRKIYQWDAKDIPGFEMEPGMPPFTEVAPVIQASTFKDWNHVGKWYWQLSKESITASEALTAKAKELVKDANTDKEKLASIYYYIIDTVRYVGIELGRNGYVPHTCDRTWRTKYGDCKDTAVLFVAMLEAVGIDARIALVRTWDRGIEPTGIPGARRFNHAIAYVPSLHGKDYWLDGTTDFNHFSELPGMDQGAMALITGPDGGRMVTIPEDPAKSNTEKFTYKIDIDNTGNAIIKAKLEYSGIYASGYRSIFTAPERFKTNLKFFLKQRFPGSTLEDFTVSSNDLKIKPVYFSFTLNAPGLASNNNGRWTLSPWLLPSQLSALARQNERKNDLMIGMVKRRTISATINLPEGADVLSLPQDINFEKNFGNITRESVSEGNTVKIEVETEVSARRVELKDYTKFRRFTNRVDSAEEEKVIYEMAKNQE